MLGRRNDTVLLGVEVDLWDFRLERGSLELYDTTRLAKSLLNIRFRKCCFGVLEVDFEW